MINKIEVIVKEFADMPRGYMVFAVPSKIDYLNKIAEILNKIPKAKLIDHFNVQDFVPDGSKITVPREPTPEIKPYEVERGTLQFKTVVYYEVLE